MKAPLRSRRLLSLALLAIAALLPSACGDAEGSSAPTTTAPPYNQLRAAELRPGSSVPKPTGPVVLTIDGAITNRNDGDRLVFDLETLERLRLVSYRADDQQGEGRVAEFSGVLLSDVLSIAGASAEATKLDTVALNDYRVEIPISDATDYPVMIASKVDGERMSVDRRGPIRIVYPNQSYQLDGNTYDPRWNWQLTRITVG